MRSAYMFRIVDMMSSSVNSTVIYIQWRCPTRGGLTVGWFYVEIEGLSSRELFLISVLTIFNVKAQVPPRTTTAAWKNNPRKTNIFFFPERIFSRFLFFEYFGKITLEHRVSIVIGLRTSRFHCHRSEYDLFEWLKLNFASCVVHQTRSYNMVFELNIRCDY